MRLNRIPGKDSRNLPRLRQRDVEHEIMPRHRSDLKQLRVQGIVRDRPLNRLRLAHKQRRMDDLDRLLRSQPWSDQLASPGKNEHHMLPNKPERNMQDRSHEALIDIDRNTATRAPQVTMLAQNARIMIDHPVFFRDR